MSLRSVWIYVTIIKELFHCFSAAYMPQNQQIRRVCVMHKIKFKLVSRSFALKQWVSNESTQRSSAPGWSDTGTQVREARKTPTWKNPQIQTQLGRKEMSACSVLCTYLQTENLLGRIEATL